MKKGLVPVRSVALLAGLVLVAIPGVVDYLRAAVPGPHVQRASVEQPADAPAPSHRSLLIRHARARSTAGAGAIAIPVRDVRAEDLRDDFGAPRSGHTHGGIDILAPRGTPVVAAVDGTIEKLYASGAGGRTIYLFDLRGERIYYYAHLNGYAMGVSEGTAVRRGDIIGFVGTSGNAPRNTPHLHFGIEKAPASGEWWKGSPVDPYPILRSRGVEY